MPQAVAEHINAWIAGRALPATFALIDSKIEAAKAQIATEMQTQPMDIEVLQWFSSFQTIEHTLLNFRVCPWW